MLGLLTLLTFGLVLLIVLLTLMLAREMQKPPRHTAAYAIARNWAVDPGDLALKYQEWVLDRSDGAALPVWEIQTPRSTGTNAIEGEHVTMVFVHGWGHSRIDVLQRIEPFMNLCDRIVLYDLRGHGESTGAKSRLGDREEHDLLALLERLERLEGGEGSYILVGHSMGAVIAIQAALARKENHPRIAGIIAYGPYCDFHESLQGRLRVAGYPRRPITDFALLTLRALGITPPGLPDKRLQDLTVPLLVIHGCDDPVSPLAHGQRIASAVPNGRLCEIPGGAHTDAHSCNPLEHAAMVRQFVLSLNQEPERKDPGNSVPGPSVLAV